MEIIEHLGHKQHKLILRGQGKKQIRDRYHSNKPELCSVCELPILSSPAYTCINGCDFFMHKSCAQLPEDVNYPYSSERLSLKINPYLNNTCKRCGKLCADIIYTHDSWNIVHPLCAAQVEIKIEHYSHNDHPLVALSRETLSLCDACGEKHEGFFFACRECNFWIHQDCALLPSIVNIPSHDHHLILIYACMSLNFTMCHLCFKGFRGKGMYLCAEKYDYYAHLRCVASNMGDFTPTGLVIHLPHQEGGHMYSSLTFRNLTANKQSPKIVEGGNEMWPIEKYHNHPLTFHDIINSDHEHASCSSSNSSIEASGLRSYSYCLDQGAVCDACIQPIISPPFWECIRPDCHFLLHDFCVNIPSKQTWFFAFNLSLYPVVNGFFHSTFPCGMCFRPCNGFGFSNDISIVDLECASAPLTITHASHDQHNHFLFRDLRVVEPTKFNCCRELWSFVRISSWAYSCISCSFKIHATCAFLPKMVSHSKFDKHLLELIFPDNMWSKRDMCICEVCEQDIDQQYWFYHCTECVQSFHIKCVPSVGLLSKIKFGTTLDVSCHPDHPVALTRMLMVGNQRCGYCNTTVDGFVDEMNFYCFNCDLWIHYSCAKKCNRDQHQSQLWYDGIE